MLLHEEPHCADVVPSIPHILWVQWQRLTCLGHNQYTRILFVKATVHPRSGTSFCENCKTNMPSSGLSVLLSEELHAIVLLPDILHVLCVHMYAWTSLKHSQYNKIMIIQATEHPSCGTRFGENYKITMSSSGCFMLLHEEQHAMDVFPPIPHVLGPWAGFTEHGT